MAEVIHTNQTGIQRDRIIRLPEVENLTGLKKSTIYWLSKNGQFPKQITVHRRLTGWSEAAVLSWVQARIEGAPAGSMPVSRASKAASGRPIDRLQKLKITKPGWHAVGSMIEHECDETPDIATFEPALFGQCDRPYEEVVANARVCAAAPAMLEILARLSDVVASNGWTRIQVLEVAEDAENLLQALGL